MHLAARLFLRHARALTALVLGACVLAGWGGSKLEVDDQPTSIIRSDDAAFAQMEEVFEQFGSDDGACLLLLEGAVNIAREFGVSETVIGLTLVAVGTSLPELATTVMAALRQ